jgi:hypothetical protein
MLCAENTWVCRCDLFAALEARRISRVEFQAYRESNLWSSRIGAYNTINVVGLGMRKLKRDTGAPPLRTFFGTKWSASGRSRNLRGFWCAVDHFWFGSIALAPETGTGVGSRIGRSSIAASGARLGVVDNFPCAANFYFARPTSIEAHQ